MEWADVIEQERGKGYCDELREFVKREYEAGACCPPIEKMFSAFDLTPYGSVKCVILGQDPYHGEKQAMGLSFSVPLGVATPRSLKNVYKELRDEYGYPIPNNGDLTPWAKQGVLLLNSILTVRAHQPGSHARCGWESFTDAVISSLNEKKEPVVFMLWGAKARAKRELVTSARHLVLEAAHPSPYSAGSGFFGCGHFARCNEFLSRNGLAPIDWQIRDV